MSGPTCIRCRSTLRRPQPGAQFECPECGLVVAPENLRDVR